MGNAFSISGISKVISNLNRLNNNVKRECKKSVKFITKEITLNAKSVHPEWNKDHSGPYVFNPDGEWRYHNITFTLTGSIKDMGIIKEGTFDNEIIGQSTAGSDDAHYAMKQEMWHPFMSVALLSNEYKFRDDIQQNLSALVR